MNDKDTINLRDWCTMELKHNFDLFDFNNHIDRALSYDENKTILMGKIKLFLDKPITKDDINSFNAATLRYQNYLNNDRTKDLTLLFNKPKIIGIIGDTNTGKSMLIYDMVRKLQKRYSFKLYSYGLRANLGEQKIYSLEELEQIKNSVVFVDEFFTLLDLEDRKNRDSIEQTLRLINHNNNILVLCGLPDNFKKFIASKLDIIFFKKCCINNFINGSIVKDRAISYKGNELGSTMLNIDNDRALLFDGIHYSMLTVEYYPGFDTKLFNKEICSVKRSDKSAENVEVKNE